jgi:hypothetical protein
LKKEDKMSRKYLESLQDRISIARTIYEVLDIYDSKDDDKLTLDEVFELDEFKEFRIQILNDESTVDDDFLNADFCSGGDLSEDEE